MTGSTSLGQYTVTWWRSSSYNNCADGNKVAGTEATYDTSARSMALPGTANGNLTRVCGQANGTAGFDLEPHPPLVKFLLCVFP